MNKLIIFCAVFFLFAFKHPIYMSVTDLKYNAMEKSIQGSVKLFINDAEAALKKVNAKSIDLINSTDKEDTKKILDNYLKKRLILKMNKELKSFDVLGYEIEEEAVWIYIEFKKCATPKKIEIENTLLYEHLKTQTNIVHFDVNGKTKSYKVSNPEKMVLFEF